MRFVPVDFTRDDLGGALASAEHRVSDATNWIWEGVVPYLTAAEVGKLADLESREVLLAKLAGAFKASLFGAAYLFNAPLAQAVRTVDALRQKQESAS